MDEKRPWDQQEGEPNRWFHRFSKYRLLGSGRSIEATYKAECETKRCKINRPSRLWHKMGKDWQWAHRAAQWDQYKTEQAEKEIDEFWRKKIMRSAEVLGRVSEAGRVNPSDFVIVEDGGRVIRLNEDALKENGYLVKSIATSTGKTNSVKIEMRDGQAATFKMGEYNKVFKSDDQNAQAVEGSSFALPADVIAPAFLNAYRDIRDRRHTEYLFFGGRGSTKSSFISLAIIYLIKNYPAMNVIALRQVADTLRDSVYAQLKWAISELGLDSEFKSTTSPLEITYLPTGQKIYFRGADDPGKIKSIKPAQGYIGIAWFEELDQFHGEEAVRKIEQSAIRGGDVAYIFKSFNPPRTLNNWANKYARIPKAAQLQHRSDYLTVPPEWLGKPFLEEAAHLKDVNPPAYEHEYLGVANSAGGLVFENVQIRAITDAEIVEFDRILHGQDWGYYPDPAHYSKSHYDAARRILYIFGEYRAWKQNNRTLYDNIKQHGYVEGDLLIADSAEPKSVADFLDYGARCRGAEKGPDSVDYSIKWLQGLTAIIIDQERCPFAADEFLTYEYEQDKDGNIISEYPDKNNHAIDSERYATNLIWRRRGQ